ncbi:MAG: DUF533 domain-containing protein [Planctomycetes bacterium]|nr:DUF533 domain-containing protein [Planctomycetota bacterium]
MLNIESLIGSLIGGTLGARGKPHRLASSFLAPRSKSFLNTGTILTAAALGFGAYEIWRTRSGNNSGPVSATIGAGGTPPPLPPPLPGIFGASGPRSTVEVKPNPTDGVGRIAALLVAAARSDGELGEAEYACILAEARKAGADKDVLSELSNPRPLEAVVSGVNDPKLAADLYALSFAVVRADTSVNAAERAWLNRLGTLLGLDHGSMARLETDTATGITQQA